MLHTVCRPQDKTPCQSHNFRFELQSELNFINICKQCEYFILDYIHQSQLSTTKLLFICSDEGSTCIKKRSTMKLDTKPKGTIMTSKLELENVCINFYSKCTTVATYFNQRFLLCNTVFNIWMHFICVNSIHKFLFCLQGFQKLVRISHLLNQFSNCCI